MYPHHEYAHGLTSWGCDIHWIWCDVDYESTGSVGTWGINDYIEIDHQAFRLVTLGYWLPIRTSNTTQVVCEFLPRKGRGHGVSNVVFKRRRKSNKEICRDSRPSKGTTGEGQMAYTGHT